MGRDSAGAGEATAAAELIEALHRASSEANAQSFPLMARRLDECRVDYATGLGHRRHDERELADRARKCLEIWSALREW